MEDSWIYVDDSSNCSLSDSDKVDSETEAELYSKIHHEPNLSCINSENTNEESPELSVFSPFKAIFSIDKRKNASTPVKPTSECTEENNILHHNLSRGKRKSPDIQIDRKGLAEKLSPAKKHKSHTVFQNDNIDSDGLKDMNDSFNFKKNNIANKNRKFNSNSRESSNKNNTAIFNSSDSDSDIWIEPNSTEKDDLKINLLKEIDTISLSSSDSDNEPDASSPFRKRDSVLRNLSMPNMKIKTDENSTGLWHINSEDLYRSKKHSHRYHDNFEVTCSNCNRKGHISRTCPSPRVIKCFVCGGNHMGFRCSNRICSNCHASGHDRKNCWREAYKGFCYLCNVEGHSKANCPDLWRRYHLTGYASDTEDFADFEMIEYDEAQKTDPYKIKKGKKLLQNINLYCWNCGKGGHFGAVCPLLQRFGNNFSSWPCVVSYDNPKGLLKNRLSILKKSSSLNMGNPNRNVNISRSSENRNIHFDTKKQPSALSGSNAENNTNKKKKKKFRTDSKFNKTQDVKERNFPRTPKISPIKHSSNFVRFEEKTVSPQVIIKKQLKKVKEKRRKKKKRNMLKEAQRERELISAS